jgi:hypothetical protein
MDLSKSFDITLQKLIKLKEFNSKFFIHNLKELKKYDLNEHLKNKNYDAISNYTKYTDSEAKTGITLDMDKLRADSKET